MAGCPPRARSAPPAGTHSPSPPQTTRLPGSKPLTPFEPRPVPTWASSLSQRERKFQSRGLAQRSTRGDSPGSIPRIAPTQPPPPLACTALGEARPVSPLSNPVGGLCWSVWPVPPQRETMLGTQGLRAAGCCPPISGPVPRARRGRSTNSPWASRVARRRTFN